MSSRPEYHNSVTNDFEAATHHDVLSPKQVGLSVVNPWPIRI